MAGVLLGRHKVACISCGFSAPHVKRNEGKLPYVHCPDCGLMCSAKNQQQARGLLANMRPETGTAPLPEPPATDQPIIVKADVTPVPAVKPDPSEPKKKASPWAVLMDLHK